MAILKLTILDTLDKQLRSEAAAAGLTLSSYVLAILAARDKPKPVVAPKQTAAELKAAKAAEYAAARAGRLRARLTEALERGVPVPELRRGIASLGYTDAEDKRIIDAVIEELAPGSPPDDGFDPDNLDFSKVTR